MRSGFLEVIRKTVSIRHGIYIGEQLESGTISPKI